MTDFVEKVKEDLEALKKLRDELMLKANLGKMDVRDLWQEAEKKWQEAEHKRHELEAASRESAKEVAAALKNLAASLQDAYKNIRSKL